MKLIKTSLSLLITVFTLSILYKCKVTENKAEISAIKPPIEGLEVNKNTFTIEPNKEALFRTSKGSEMIIPANSIVYADGSEVTEKVEIEFSEFHNMAEIALSGIPMVYNDNGVPSNFISGGMFKIKGKAVSGKEVKVKNGENLTVNLASNKEGEFDLFLLNEKTGEWSNLSQKIVQSSIDTAPNLPEVPEKPGENDVILDLNISKYNGIYSFESNMWKVLGNISENKKKRISETDWTKYEIETIDERALIYSVKLSKKKEELVVQATPVLSPSDRDKCKEGVANEIASMQKDLASNFYKPRVVRSVSIGGFGTVNCDVFVATDQNLVCDVKVEGVKTEEIDFVQFDYTQDMMVRVSNGNLQFKPESKNLLVGLLPDDKVAVFTPDQYESLKKMDKGSTVEVELKKMDVTINSVNDLQEIIMSYL